MNKKVIAIISVLKPVDDTRNYEKIATSLGNTNKYDINIIGFKPKNIPKDNTLTFHPVFDFDRDNPKRLFASWTIWRKLIKLKPELIIVTCPELLIVICLYKILFGSKIVYDIQENYVRNFLYSGAYSLHLKHVAAVSVRLLEYLSSPFIDQFILAERIYANQLPFIRKRYLIIENKAVLPKDQVHTTNLPEKTFRFLYCGTIARHYGILDAIIFFERLQKLIPNIHLIIAGHSPDSKLFNEIIMRTRNNPSICSINDGGPMPHNDIVNLMLNSHFVLMPYYSDKSIEGRLPTKLFECLAMKIPVIISHNPAWDDIIKKNNAGIIHDFNSPVMPELIIRLQTAVFYENHNPEPFLWSSNEKLLIKVVENIF